MLAKLCLYLEDVYRLAAAPSRYAELGLHMPLLITRHQIFSFKCPPPPPPPLLLPPPPLLGSCQLASITSLCPLPPTPRLPSPFHVLRLFTRAKPPEGDGEKKT